MVLVEAGVVVSVELELAGEGSGSFGGAHAADGEGAGGVLVAEGHEVGRVGAEECDDHIACDAPLVFVGSSEYPGEAASQAGVGGMALERRGQLRLPVACDDGIHDAFEGGVCGSQGGEFPEKGL